MVKKGFPKIYLPDRIREAGLRPLRTLTLAITHDCNLRCAHCWPESGTEGRRTLVPAETIRRIASEFSRLGGVELILTGGEPLTHPDWKSILDHCRGAGFQSVTLQTNATRIGGPEAEVLASPAPTALRIQVSLEGASAETNDRLRGRGVFHRAMAGLTALCDAGLGPRTSVALTETDQNVGEIPDLMARLEAMGVGGLVTGTLVKGGRARSAEDLRLPSADQYRDLVRRYEADGDFHARYHRMATISALEWHLGMGSSVAPGCRCLETLYIDADGRCHPCGLLQHPDYAVPGAHVRPLTEIIGAGLPRWKPLPEISRRRAVELARCQGCPGHAHCGGGCTGRALSAHGVLMAVEDRCHLRRAVYDEVGSLKWEA